MAKATWAKSYQAKERSAHLYRPVTYCGEHAGYLRLCDNRAAWTVFESHVASKCKTCERKNRQ